MNPLTPPCSPPRSTRPPVAQPPRRPPTPPHRPHPTAHIAFSRTCCVHKGQPKRHGPTATNKNGNAGRFYYICTECPDPDDFFGWDDTVGIFPENPLCKCKPPWRTRLGRKTDGTLVWLSCANPGVKCAFKDPEWPGRKCTEEDIAALEKQKRGVLDRGEYNYYREEVKEDEESKKEEKGGEESDMRELENRVNLVRL